MVRQRPWGSDSGNAGFLCTGFHNFRQEFFLSCNALQEMINFQPVKIPVEAFRCDGLGWGDINRAAKGPKQLQQLSNVNDDTATEQRKR